jgi:hypothetical protein
MSVETRNVLILGFLEFLQIPLYEIKRGLSICFGTSVQIRYLLTMLPSDAVCCYLLTGLLTGAQVKE